MSHWSQQVERSNLFWLSALSFAANVLGRGFLAVLCAPIALFFLVTASDARKASRDFLTLVQAGEYHWWHTFRHFYCFARVSSDRLLFLSGKWDRFSLDIEGEDLIRNFEASQRGCLLLVSHLGSFDAMRVPAVEQEHIRLRILIDKAHNPAAMRVISQLNPQLAADMIDASAPGASLALSLKELLDDGQMVGIMADRAALGETVVPVEFLGRQAQFPASPWMMAMALKVPVILCFATWEGGNRYRIRFHQVSDGSPVPRRERQQQLLQNMREYAAILEQYARERPYSWFNFYDFWTDASTRD
ncbi:MAG: acyltransferase [Halioglobus sp.]